VRRNIIIMAAVALMAATGGYFAAMVLSSQAGSAGSARIQPPGDALPAQPDDMRGQRRPDFTLADTHGSHWSATDLNGRPWLVNFWATWCAPCVEEMPMLSRLQQDYEELGLRVVGIALDDPDDAREFADSLSIDYPVLVGLTDVVLVGRKYGNRSGMLPYTVLVDAEGIIRWTHLGALDRENLDQQIDLLK
jgi:peroxiredoxin